MTHAFFYEFCHGCCKAACLQYKSPKMRKLIQQEKEKKENQRKKIKKRVSKYYLNN